MKKGICSVFFLILICVFICGCANIKDRVIGTWKKVSGSFSVGFGNYGETDDLYIIIEKNGSIDIQTGYPRYSIGSATYDLTDNRLTINDIFPLNFSYELKNDRLEIVSSSGKSTFIKIDGCKHQNTEALNKKEATCINTGYSGDIVCRDCGISVSQGHIIEATGHAITNRINISSPTCQYEGNAGDGICSKCGEMIEGEKIPFLDHQFVNGRCVQCGWITPGLYLNDTLEFTWEQLISQSYVTVKNQSITGINENLSGRLVIEEGITISEWALSNNSYLNEIYLPRTYTVIGTNAFRSAPVSSVKFFGRIEKIETAAFSKSKITSIVIPEGITTIPEDCFWDCQSLQSVILPDSLIEIGNNAFFRCSALTHINLPGHIQTIGDSCFNSSGLETIILPATVSDIGKSCFEFCNALISADLSSCAITKLKENAFSYCHCLVEIQLPKGLVNGKDFLVEDDSLKYLIIPDSVRSFSLGGNYMYPVDSLEWVVWPIGLTDASGFDAARNIKTVYYRGSEMQWNLVEGKLDWYEHNIFENTRIVYNATESNWANNISSSASQAQEAQYEEAEEAQNGEDQYLPEENWLIPGFNMTEAQLEREFESVLLQAKTWTKETAPQRLQDFPFLPIVHNPTPQLVLYGDNEAYYSASITNVFDIIYPKLHLSNYTEEPEYKYYWLPYGNNTYAWDSESGNVPFHSSEGFQIWLGSWLTDSGFHDAYDIDTSVNGQLFSSQHNILFYFEEGYDIDINNVANNMHSAIHIFGNNPYLYSRLMFQLKTSLSGFSMLSWDIAVYFPDDTYVWLTYDETNKLIGFIKDKLDSVE